MSSTNHVISDFSQNNTIERVRTKSINSLEVARGFAAVSVVITHAEIHLPVLRYAGVLGVDIFFVLSGFLMIHTFRKQRTGFRFLFSRIKRIYPPYLVFSFPLIITAFPLISDEHKLTFLLHNITLIPSFSENYEWANIASWTLMYEMYFYTMFSLVSVLFKCRIHVFIAVSVLLFSLFIYFRINYSLGEAGWADLTVKNICGNMIVIDLFAGMLIGLLHQCKIHRLFQLPNFFVYTLSFIIFALSCAQVTSFIPSGTDSRYQLFILLYSSLPAVVIVLLLSLGRNGSTKFERHLCYIGRCSYSIYLCHVYFVSDNTTGVKNFLDYFLIHLNYFAPYLSNFILVIIASLAGILLYEKVEKR